MRKAFPVVIALSIAVLALISVRLTIQPRVALADGHQPAVRADTSDLLVDVSVNGETTLADEILTYTVLYTNTLSGQDLQDVEVVATLMSHQYFSGTYVSDPLIPTTNFTYTGDFDNGYELS